MTEVAKILQDFDLKKTKLRVMLIQMFLDSKQPLSQSDLMKQLKVDRTTVYRNLLILKGAGIIHELQSNVYKICAHDHHHETHIVMSCESCLSSIEMHDDQNQKKLARLLAQIGFLNTQKNLYMRGQCQKCANKVANEHL